MEFPICWGPPLPPKVFNLKIKISHSVFGLLRGKIEMPKNNFEDIKKMQIFNMLGGRGVNQHVENSICFLHLLFESFSEYLRYPNFNLRSYALGFDIQINNLKLSLKLSLKFKLNSISNHCNRCNFHFGLGTSIMVGSLPCVSHKRVNYFDIKPKKVF